MYNGDMSTYYAEKFYTMGKRIEARLVALDMNQTDLHDELRRLGVHVSRSFISQLIGDKKSISAENLPYLAKALETTTDHLLLLRDDPEPYTEKEATIERTEAALRRVDDAMVDGMIDGDRYRRQVDRLNAQAATARAEIARLRKRYDDEADRDKRRERMRQVSAIGLAMLDEPPHVANAWLRRNVRLWCKDGRIVVVDWL